MVKEILLATQALEDAVIKAPYDPYRPRYHFSAPANWMNDPNGTIFHNGEYHLFYQLNPYGDRWGQIHWGHAKSTDLVHWQHLPIALAPQREFNERHCFSGSCVIHKNTPIIFYTKISNLSSATRGFFGAEQWMALGDPTLIRWKKHPNNPIIPQSIHPDRKVLNWRDPYVWRQDANWNMIVAGQHPGELFGSAFLYTSKNMMKWEYVGRLYAGNKSLGRIWECPNYFPLGDQHILLVSSSHRAIYSIGEFYNNRHIANQWFSFDHGNFFSATNTYFDDQGRTIIVGWIKTKGRGGWAGCLSLPREVTLAQGGGLQINPIPEINHLRRNHISITRRAPTIAGISRIDPIFGDSLEIKARFNLERASYAGFKLLDDSGEYLLTYNYSTNTLTAIHEKANLQFFPDKQPIDLHIFIDRSVIEIFINGRECFTTVFHPTITNNKSSLKIIPFVSGGQGEFSIDVWEIADPETSS